MKPYKACEPNYSVHNIREKLFNLGITLKEWHYDSNLFYACKVSICSEGLENLNISSNGKGMSSLYSLASAYGEFMERLQNNILWENYDCYSKEILELSDTDVKFKNTLLENKLNLYFQHDPKEKEITVDESTETYYFFYKDLFPFVSNKNELVKFIKSDLNFNTLISIPFYSVFDSTEMYLPIELIIAACGSTGMCGGNSKNEALIQGFCEIFERYVGREIYNNQITPPDIPLEYFRNNRIYDKIQKIIKNKNYTIKIKDCSLGKGLPVIGFLIIDNENRKYNFHLGSSLSPIIALERCLTEIHQNPNGIYWLDINLEDSPNNQIEKDKFTFFNGNNIFAFGIGHWPNSIFSDKFSYKFEGLNYGLNYSDSEDIKFIKNKISELGFNIFLRDVSFLGFPSYYIVVPGMSEYPVHKKQYNYLGNFRSELKKIRNLKNLTDNELHSICNEMNENYDIIKLTRYRYQSILLYHTNNDIHDLDTELFMFMLNYRLKNYNTAYKYISLFLKNKDFSAYKYYYGVKDYVALIIQNKPKTEILYILNSIYKEDEAVEIIQDLEFPEKIFQYYEWPSCFNCERCEIIEDCKYFKFLKLLKRIQEKQSDNIIDHSKIVI